MDRLASSFRAFLLLHWPVCPGLLFWAVVLRADFQRAHIASVAVAGLIANV